MYSSTLLLDVSQIEIEFSSFNTEVTFGPIPTRFDDTSREKKYVITTKRKKFVAVLINLVQDSFKYDRVFIFVFFNFQSIIFKKLRSLIWCSVHSSW